MALAAPPRPRGRGPALAAAAPAAAAAVVPLQEFVKGVQPALGALAPGTVSGAPLALLPRTILHAAGPHQGLNRRHKLRRCLELLLHPGLVRQTRTCLRSPAARGAVCAPEAVKVLAPRQLYQLHRLGHQIHDVVIALALHHDAPVVAVLAHRNSQHFLVAARASAPRPLLCDGEAREGRLQPAVPLRNFLVLSHHRHRRGVLLLLLRGSLAVHSAAVFVVGGVVETTLNELASQPSHLLAQNLVQQRPVPGHSAGKVPQRNDEGPSLLLGLVRG
mmetsp:Transcript_881/g.3286  ORF Transcript_881/g.3286 Transcript_881/m.3286 type:complete len:275 (+) Transcript_881:2084-2908(+)